MSVYAVSPGCELIMAEGEPVFFGILVAFAVLVFLGILAGYFGWFPV